jgi:D-alanyl-lipoteichoic acid acyltransferase DltB (MBOAT superfamily)
MAIACAALLGYRLTVNFLFPYFAHSLQEFWRRWHISLSTWLRDYLYISLGGNRISARVTYVNLMMTMILGGLWHGAAWTFVVWGAIHGVGLALERGLTGIADRISIQCPMIIKVALVFFLVNIAWIFFRAPDLESAVTIVTAYALWSSSGALALDPTLVLIPVVLAAAHYISYRDWAFTRLASLRPATFSLIYAMSWALIVALVPNGNRPFIYFQF